MQALILLGLRRSKDGPEVVNLYTGLNGVELEKAHAQAVAKGGFDRIERFTNPSGAPMATSDVETTRTTPTFPRQKAAQLKTRLQPSPSHIVKRDTAEELLRKERLRVSQASATVEDQKPKPIPVNDGGPTFEEWVTQGRAPTAYPPIGFTAKESAGWALFQESLKAPPVTTTQPAEPVASDFAPEVAPNSQPEIKAGAPITPASDETTQTQTADESATEQTQ